MKKTNIQKKRIIENIFDIVCGNEYAEKASKQMAKDLRNKNITLDTEKMTIEIQNADATITQYKLSII
jgi:hypothetical protein